MQEEEGKELVADAIRAGVFNDLGSGSNVDICVIRKTEIRGPVFDSRSVEYIRPYDVANEKGKREGSYRYKRGTTAILNKTVHPIVIEEENCTENRTNGYVNGYIIINNLTSLIFYFIGLFLYLNSCLVDMDLN